LQQMPGRYADSTRRFARQDVAKRSLSEMPEHFHDSAQTRFWGAGFAGAGDADAAYSGANWRGTNKSTRAAGVRLRTGETGRCPDGNYPRTSETIFNEPNCGSIASIEIADTEIVGIENTWRAGGKLENKIARTAVRSCSPT
jgi:hypothetical protein